MVKIWAEVFWKARPEEAASQQPEPRTEGLAWMYVAIAGLAGCTIFIGLNGQPIYDLAEVAAEQLMQPQGYIDAVLEARQ